MLYMRFLAGKTLEKYFLDRQILGKLSKDF